MAAPMRFAIAVAVALALTLPSLLLLLFSLILLSLLLDLAIAHSGSRLDANVALTCALAAALFSVSHSMGWVSGRRDDHHFWLLRKGTWGEAVRHRSTKHLEGLIGLVG
jgi:hypothetical protein